jgi:hypothetical protein
MTAQWEYLVYQWSRFATMKTRPDNTNHWYHEIKVFITRPGSSKPEEIIIWSSGGGEKRSAHDIYNELGAEGWEMVGVTPTEMMMQDEVNGYRNSSTPVTVTILFKRLI